MSEREPPKSATAQLPSLEALDVCLELLAKQPGEIGTLELHDPIYLMRRDADPLQLPILRASLELHSEHPVARQISGLLVAWLPKVEQNLESVLRKDAPIPQGVEPLAELASRLEESRRVRMMLEERVTQLEARAGLWMRTSNVLAAAGALIAVVGVIGWLVALGALSIPWVESPTVEVPESEADE
jgi:hypothetical protein